MIELQALRPAPGARKKKRRLGQGPGSGRGKTAGRGQKGQSSRSGFSLYVGFEGGQMPLHRRLPKRGFTNIFKKRYAIVNLDQLERCFEADEHVTPETVVAKGLVKRIHDGLKILGRGELTKPLIVSAHAVSRSAREKIENAGGRVEVIG